MAVRAYSGQSRSYLVSNILGVSPTQISFSPRLFLIELTPSGPQSIPATSAIDRHRCCPKLDAPAVNSPHHEFRPIVRLSLHEFAGKLFERKHAGLYSLGHIRPQQAGLATEPTGLTSEQNTSLRRYAARLAFTTLIWLTRARGGARRHRARRRDRPARPEAARSPIHNPELLTDVSSAISFFSCAASNSSWAWRRWL